MQQTISISQEDLEKVVVESGLWKNGVRQGRYDFLLSPDAFKLSNEQVEELHKLAKVIQSCLAGMGRVAAIAGRTEIGHSRTWRRLKRIFNTSIPNYYEDLEQIHPSRTPVVCKVDCLLNERGEFKIVEMDAHNKHGMGYCTLAAKISEVLGIQSAFKGLPHLLAGEIQRRGYTGLNVFLASQEEFYLPETRILLEALGGYGLSTELIFDKRESRYYSKIKGEGLPDGLYLDFPFIFHNTSLVESLSQRYREGRIEFLIPPKPFLGSKALLALLRNDDEDAELEAILLSQIPKEDLGLVRKYIPTTYLIREGYTGKPDSWPDLGGVSFYQVPHVYKECVSSGMKGVRFDEELIGKHGERRQITGSNFKFIRQDEVKNASIPLRYFDRQGVLREDIWFCRLTLFCSWSGVAGVIVTARKDRRVHGAIDCLQLPVILER